MRIERNEQNTLHKNSLERMSQEYSKENKLHLNNKNTSMVNLTDRKFSYACSTNYKSGFLNKNSKVVEENILKESKNPLTKSLKRNFLLSETSTGFNKGSETARKLQEPTEKSNHITPDKVSLKGAMKIKNFYNVVKKASLTSGSNSARVTSSKPEYILNGNGKKPSRVKI